MLMCQSPTGTGPFSASSLQEFIRSLCNHLCVRQRNSPAPSSPSRCTAGITDLPAVSPTPRLFWLRVRDNLRYQKAKMTVNIICYVRILPSSKLSLFTAVTSLLGHTSEGLLGLIMQLMNADTFSNLFQGLRNKLFHVVKCPVQ